MKQQCSLACVLVTFILVGTATAELPNDALVCPPNNPELDKLAYLRAVSLDLRGNVPTLEEYEFVQGAEDVPEALIDDWLASDEFADRVVRRHRDLLWNNITNVNLMNNRASLGRYGSSQLYYVRARGQLLRGAIVGCLDEPVSYNSDGTIKTTQGVSNGSIVQQEGYVMLSPYWAPTTTIKVCAFDAQTNAVGPDGVQCGTLDGLLSTSCGCGEDLRWCRYGSVNRTITQAMGKEVELRINDLIKDDRPYIDLFTESVMYVNGPLSYFLRHHVNLPANVRLTPLGFAVDQVPVLEFTDVDTWVPMPLPKHYAGVLTSPAFLLRFQTNRARANRYYNEFLCQPFQPPKGGIPLGDGTTLQHADLQLRDGCKYCHALLEPAGSYWGRWSENGAGYLNAFDYPAFQPSCEECATTGIVCNDACRRSYKIAALSDEEIPFLGWLTAYEFRRPEHVVNVEQGPRLLALSTTVDHRLPECVSKTTTEWLLGRQLEGDEDDWVHQMSIDFVAQGYSYKELVKAIVTSPVYRRVK